MNGAEIIFFIENCFDFKSNECISLFKAGDNCCV